MIVYCILNRLNGKVYVGGTQKSLHERWKCHVRQSCSGPRPLHRDIRQYGAEAFFVYSMQRVDTTRDLRKYEAIWTFLMDSKYPKGYNLITTGYQHKKETPQRISRALKNPSAATRKKMAAGQIGRRWTKEQRRTMSEARKGRIQPLAVRNKISQSHFGITHSAATKELLRKLALEQFAKMRAEGRPIGRPRKSP